PGVGQRHDPLGIPREQPEGSATAHRVPDEVDTLYAQVIEELAYVGAERDPAGAILDVGGASEGSVVERDHRVAVYEGGHLLPPRHRVAARAVREEDRRGDA